MKKLISSLLLCLSLTSVASDMPIKDIKPGMNAVYFVGHLYREVGQILSVYSDGTVRIRHTSSIYTRKIKNIGIETKNGCLLDICKGDTVKYFTAFEGFQIGEVLNVFDDGIVKIDARNSCRYRKVSDVSVMINP